MEKLEQQRKSSVLEGAFWSWLSTVINLLALLIIGKLFVISLSKEEVATFSLLLVWSDGFILFFGYGLNVSIPKLIGSAPDNEKNSLSSSLLFFSIINVIAVSIIILIIWGLLYWFLPVWKNSGNSSLLFSYFWIAPFLFCIGLPRDILLANLSGFQVFGKRALGVTISSTLQVLFSIFVLVILKGKIVSLSVAYMISYFLTTVLLWRSLPTERSFQLNFSQVVSAIKFSWILWINSILNYLVQRFDTVVLLFLTGSPIQVAIYEMAKRLCIIASRMLGAILLPYLPRISELFSLNLANKANQFFVQTQNAIAILSFAGIMFLPFIQKYIILLLFSKEYMEITSILVLLLAGIVFAVLSGISGQTLIASNRPYIVTLTNIGTVAINLGLNFLLIPRLGMIGAGWSSLASFFFSYIVQTFWAKKTCIQFEWSKILTPLFVFACFLLFYTYFPHLVWVNSLFILVLLIISYVFNLIPFEYLYTRIIKRIQVKS
ncbi:MAG TPA: polysaccharide biosynthesis C-terminal domain-containing protein [Candidatus Hydrogenedens sp.]|nr:polysaccharide biosynthesis C-terminal domain-containing protein [Candidatus Hydrogenedens sp.]